MPDEPCPICLDVACAGAPRFKGLCPRLVAKNHALEPRARDRSFLAALSKVRPDVWWPRNASKDCPVPGRTLRWTPCVLSSSDR